MMQRSRTGSPQEHPSSGHRRWPSNHPRPRRAPPRAAPALAAAPGHKRIRPALPRSDQPGRSEWRAPCAGRARRVSPPPRPVPRHQQNHERQLQPAQVVLDGRTSVGRRVASTQAQVCRQLIGRSRRCLRSMFHRRGCRRLNPRWRRGRGSSPRRRRRANSHFTSDGWGRHRTLPCHVLFTLTVQTSPGAGAASGHMPRLRAVEAEPCQACWHGEGQERRPVALPLGLRSPAPTKATPCTRKLHARRLRPRNRQGHASSRLRALHS